MTESRVVPTGPSPRAGQTLPRPAPRPDPLTEPFWSAVAAGVLKIQRCAGCDTYFHPPVGMCPDCLSCDLHFSAVSGNGTLYSFTATHSGARHPAFAERLPYLVALVELVEQPGLLLFCNLPEHDPDELRIGMSVIFYPELREDEVVVPEFRLDSPSAVDGKVSTW